MHQKIKDDLSILNYYTGQIILGTAFLFLIPVIVSVIYTEWNVVLDFIISFSVSAVLGLIMVITGKRKAVLLKFEWKHGMSIAAFAWLILMVLCAIPYYLSGNMSSFLDACFDVMSGFTTTGLALINNLDHLSMGLNMWRHLLTYVGGQGMIVLALTFFVKNLSGGYKMYVGEAKDVEIAPNVKNTAKIIWIISFAYLIIGTFFLWIDGMIIGLSPASAFFHGLFIYMSSWSTGGFAPMTQNIIYYHSFSYEMITTVFFILGSLNFGLHYAVWKGNYKEIIKNIETQSFMITAALISFFTVKGLANLNVYPDTISLFRRGIYNVISAHTTTGFANIYARQFFLEWGDFAVLLVIIAMLIGGSATSTAGGFKGLRVGVIFKGIIAEIKKTLYSDKKIKVFKYNYLNGEKSRVLDDVTLKMSLIIVLCYIITFTIGTIIGTACGYPLLSAAFESASVTGNVGLSIGVTSTSMPVIMKVYYIIAMYLGRLEFISVFSMIGFAISGVKNIWKI